MQPKARGVLKLIKSKLMSRSLTDPTPQRNTQAWLPTQAVYSRLLFVFLSHGPHSFCLTAAADSAHSQCHMPSYNTDLMALLKSPVL